MCEWSQGNTILFYIQLQQLHRTFTLDFTQVTFLKLYANILSLRVDFFEMIRVTLNNLCLLIYIKTDKKQVWIWFRLKLNFSSKCKIHSKNILHVQFYVYPLFFQIYLKFHKCKVPKWRFIPAKMLSMNAVIPETQQDKKESGDLLISPCNVK